MRFAPAREAFEYTYICVCMRACVCIYIYIIRRIGTTCTEKGESRANESSSMLLQSRRLRCNTRKIVHARPVRRDTDYRWRDLIKHVDCSSAFMANFTLFVSTESYFFVETRLVYVVRAPLIRDTSRTVYLNCDRLAISALVSFENFFVRYITLIRYATLKYRHISPNIVVYFSYPVLFFLMSRYKG